MLLFIFNHALNVPSGHHTVSYFRMYDGTEKEILCHSLHVGLQEAQGHNSAVHRGNLQICSGTTTGTCK